jgi:hypothetical protein
MRSELRSYLWVPRSVECCFKYNATREACWLECLLDVLEKHGSRSEEEDLRFEGGNGWPGSG